MEPDQQMRNLRDFLMVYNRMTEICFQRCTSNFNYRNLTMDEERCVDSCAGKLIRSNHRLMGTYVQLMPRMVQRRMEEMESKAAEAEAAAAAAASGAVGPAATEALPTTQTPIAPSPPTQIPPMLPPTVTDVGPVQTPAVPGQATDIFVVSAPSPVSGEAMVRPDMHDSVLQPAAVHIPLELDAAASKSTAAAPVTEMKLAAATALTSATETVNPLALNKPASGPSYTAVLPQSAIAGTQIESGNSMSVSVLPVFTPSRPITLSEDAPVSTVAAPTVSKATESLSGQDKAPEVSPLSGQ
ncbi:mitochondrial import inner membrane translocase subunit Tim10 B [Centroberyx gerrardi]|uniref:mitochondrial import inner membrane translocase subunit Tim10 B n=1 Tax=Centroberyx gerrardi TaxID=166262 RepID=UPI003AAFBF3E